MSLIEHLQELFDTERLLREEEGILAGLRAAARGAAKAGLVMGLVALVVCAGVLLFGARHYLNVAAPAWFSFVLFLSIMLFFLLSLGTVLEFFSTPDTTDLKRLTTFRNHTLPQLADRLLGARQVLLLKQGRHYLVPQASLYRMEHLIDTDCKDPLYVDSAVVEALVRTARDLPAALEPAARTALQGTFGSARLGDGEVQALTDVPVAF